MNRIATALARWSCTLIGGVLLGAGIVLHGQVHLARHLQCQVEETFFLWRAVGRATIFLQGDDVRLALAMSEVSPQTLQESDRAAWTLVVVGALLALTGPLLHGKPRPGGGRRRVSC